jgi:copper chaperone CopZ
LHICCGACVKAIDKALTAVEGVSGLDVDRDAREVRFQVSDAATSRAALQAVVKAGYFGKAKYEGRGVDMPQEVIEKGTKVDRVVLESMHICCKGCAKAITESVKDEKSVVAVDCDTKKGTVAFSGTEMELARLLEALHKAGFHGTVKQ